MLDKNLALATAASLCALGATAAAQSPTLLVDLDPTPTPPEITTDGRAEVIGTALGRLWLSGVRYELGRPVFTVGSPGRVPEQFELPEPGSPAVSYGELVAVFDLGNGRAVLAVESSDGLVLFGTDGSTAGTFDLQISGASLPGAAQPPDAPGIVLFRGVDPVDGATAIYVTDGTPAGTLIRAKDTFNGRLFAYEDGVVYAAVAGQTTIRRLAAAGGDPVDLVSSALGQPDFQPILVGGELLFAWREPSLGIELWASDGTPAGTGLLQDIRPGSPGSAPTLLASTGTTGYLTASTAAEGRELWITDGTAAGTQLVTDLQPGAASGIGPTPPSALLGDRLVYVTGATGLGQELHVSDGTSAGTVLVADIAPGTASSSPKDLRSVAGRVYFSAEGPVGREAYSTDGATALLAGDVGLGTTFTEPRGFTQYGDRVWFAESRILGDREPYSVDLAGTNLSPEGEIGLAPATLNTHFLSFALAADRGFLVTSRTVPGPGAYSLRVTDGTAAGTVEVVTSDEFIDLLGPLDDGVLLRRAVGGSEVQLWSSDGTPGGTQQLDLLAGGLSVETTSLSPVGQLGSRAYFLAGTAELGLEFWSTDGTQAGTGLVVDLEPGPADGLASGAAVVDDRIYFRRSSGPGQERLWTTDGSASGFEPVAPNLLDSVSIVSLVPLVDQLAFFGREGNLLSLWVTNGTEQGTRVLVPNLPSTAALQSRSIGNTVLWIENQPPFGENLILLRSAGLSGIVANLLVEPLGGSITVTDAGGSGAYFTLQGSIVQPPGTYFTDGTPAGTVRVGDLPRVTSLIGSGSEGLQNRPSGSLGTELWSTDGNAASSSLVVDVEPGAISSNPIFLGRVGDAVLFSAFTQAQGRELHAVSLSELGGFAAVPFGQGCGASATPDLRVVGDVRLGTTVALVTADIQPFAPVALYASATANPAPLGACTLYLQSPLNFGLLQSGPTGDGSLSFAIADNAAFLGLDLYLQGAAIVIGGPALGALELTNAVEIVFGQ